MEKKNKKIPYALKDGKRVFVADIAKGENGCVCPKCGNEVHVKKGPIRAHHFYHLIKTDCDGGLETFIHLLAKETFEEHKILSLPRIEINRKNVTDKSLKTIMETFELETVPLSPERKDVSFVNVELEKPIENGRIPDAIATEKNGEKLYVEFKYSNAVKDAKQNEFNELHLNCVEIDVRDFELLVPDEEHNYTDEDNKQKMLQFLRQRTDKFKWISFCYSPDFVTEKIKAEKQRVYELAKNLILKNKFNIPPIKINNTHQSPELIKLMTYFNRDTFQFIPQYKNVKNITYKEQTLPFYDILLDNLNIVIHHESMVEFPSSNDITIKYNNLSIEEHQNIKDSSFCLEVNINKLLFTESNENEILEYISKAENHRWICNNEFLIQELEKEKNKREFQKRIEKEKRLKELEEEAKRQEQAYYEERQKNEQQQILANNKKLNVLTSQPIIENTQEVDDFVFNIYLIYSQNEIRPYSKSNINNFINNMTAEESTMIQKYLCEIERLIENNRRDFFPLILDIYHGISQRVPNFKLEKISRLKYIGSI